MQKNIVNSALNAALSITEQNISSIEKIHNRYKIGRYIGRNLFMLISLSIMVGYIFAIVKYFDNYNLIMILIPMILSLLSTKVIGIGKSEVTKQSIYLCLHISVGIFIFYTTIKSIMDFNKNTLDLVLSLIFSILFILFLGYSLFHISKNLADAAIRSFVNKRYIVAIELVNSKEIIGELLTITNKNDYILRIQEIDKEILIKSNNVISVTILDEIRLSSGGGKE